MTDNWEPIEVEVPEDGFGMVLSIRFTHFEAGAISDAAEARGEFLTDFARTAILNAATTQNLSGTGAIISGNGLVAVRRKGASTWQEQQ